MSRRAPRSLWENASKFSMTDIRNAAAKAEARVTELANLLNAEYVSAQDMKPKRKKDAER